MKYINVGFILFVLLCFSQASFCETLSSQSKFSSHINLQGTNDISARANKNSSPFDGSYSPIMHDPMINSAMQGFGNMMQGCNVDARMMQEQSKMQMDYAKQQMNNAEKSE